MGVQTKLWSLCTCTKSCSDFKDPDTSKKECVDISVGFLVCFIAVNPSASTPNHVDFSVYGSFSPRASGIHVLSSGRVTGVSVTLN